MFFRNICLYMFGWISSDKTIPFFLNAGKTTLGHGNTDINIQGPGVAALHCYIENQAGTITLFPCGNPCSMDGLAVTKPVRLSQGTHTLNGLGENQRKCLPDVSCSFCLQPHMAKSHNPFTSWAFFSEWKSAIFQTKNGERRYTTVNIMTLIHQESRHANCTGLSFYMDF